MWTDNINYAIFVILKNILLTSLNCAVEYYLMHYIYVDESGQFKPDRNLPYFILASFMTSKPRSTANAYRSWQRLKLPKKMRRDTEIKFSKLRLGYALKLKTLKHLMKSDLRIRYCYVRTTNIPHDYREKSGLKEGLLYAHLIGEMLSRYFPINDTQITVVCDKRNLKGLTSLQFIEQTTTHLLPLVGKNTRLEVQMLDSTSSANLQIIDWIAGALSAYHNQKTLGNEMFEILQEKIEETGIELFKNY